MTDEAFEKAKLIEELTEGLDEVSSEFKKSVRRWIGGIDHDDNEAYTKKINDAFDGLITNFKNELREEFESL